MTRPWDEDNFLDWWANTVSTYLTTERSLILISAGMSEKKTCLGELQRTFFCIVKKCIFLLVSIFFFFSWRRYFVVIYFDCVFPLCFSEVWGGLSGYILEGWKQRGRNTERPESPDLFNLPKDLFNLFWHNPLLWKPSEAMGFLVMGKLKQISELQKLSWHQSELPPSSHPLCLV